VAPADPNNWGDGIAANQDFETRGWPGNVAGPGSTKVRGDERTTLSGQKRTQRPAELSHILVYPWLESTANGAAGPGGPGEQQVRAPRDHVAGGALVRSELVG